MLLPALLVLRLPLLQLFPLALLRQPLQLRHLGLIALQALLELLQGGQGALVGLVKLPEALHAGGVILHPLALLFELLGPLGHLPLTLLLAELERFREIPLLLP